MSKTNHNRQYTVMLILLNTDSSTITGFENGIDCNNQVKIL